MVELLNVPFHNVSEMVLFPRKTNLLNEPPERVPTFVRLSESVTFENNPEVNVPNN